MKGVPELEGQPSPRLPPSRTNGVEEGSCLNCTLQIPIRLGDYSQKAIIGRKNGGAERKRREKKSVGEEVEMFPEGHHREKHFAGFVGLGAPHCGSVAWAGTPRSSLCQLVRLCCHVALGARG